MASTRVVKISNNLPMGLREVGPPRYHVLNPLLMGGGMPIDESGYRHSIFTPRHPHNIRR